MTDKTQPTAHAEITAPISADLRGIEQEASELPEPSPTAGMNLGQRILHVGGRENAAGYIEFGSVAAVRALVSQVLRDRHAAQPARECLHLSAESARWYSVSSSGMATLCADEADARATAEDSDMIFPRFAPHTAVQLAPLKAAPAPAQAVAVPAAIDPSRCAQDVFDGGVSIGLFDIPKDTANAICAGIATATGVRVDWHYIAGRVHMKALAAAPAQAVAVDYEKELTHAALRNYDLRMEKEALVAALQEQAQEHATQLAGQGQEEAQAAKLTKPARVGGGTFGVGVAERYVIDAAQRQYEIQGEREAMTRDQFVEDERKRRALWEMIHGPLPATPIAAAPAQAQEDARDTERLDWLTFNLSGSALRAIGVVWSEHADARRAIDAARAAQG